MTKQAVKGSRVDWVDYAKGISILFVVLLYSSGTAESVLHQRGWVHSVGEFVQGFRMPAFFVIAGLFAARTLHLPWRRYLDRKVIHFFYFYVLWVTIDFSVAYWRDILSPNGLSALGRYLILFLQPQGHLWFIYLLALFFVAIKSVQRYPAWLLLCLAVTLKLIDLQTGWKLIDRFGMYFLFFAFGYIFSARILIAVECLRDRPAMCASLILGWSVVNAGAIYFGLGETPLAHLILGVSGAMSVFVLACLLEKIESFKWLYLLGKHSLVVFVGFMVPLILLRKLMIVAGWPADVNLATLLMTGISIAAALVVHAAVRPTHLAFLFRRPEWISIDRANSPVLRTGNDRRKPVVSAKQ